VTRLHSRTWKTIPFAAMAAVLAFASPAAAAGSSTTVQAVPSAATVGETVLLNATVSCTQDPTGDGGVSFWDGGDRLDGGGDPDNLGVPVGGDGTASFSASFATTGSHQITAVYSGNGIGDADCASSSGETTVVVSAAPVPPSPPAGFCLLACGGLISFNAGNIHNEIVIH
jgi:Big-like domain-containing protein